ncbi:MAG TPA: CopG family ribbon-helix-helix protein [Nitrososphaeraceae archaeon]
MIKSKRTQVNTKKQKANKISMSLPPMLLVEFEKSMVNAGYTDRSKAIQAALHSFVDDYYWKGNDDDDGDMSKKGAGVIILLYDNRIYNQDKKSVHVQHLYNDIISAATHVHLEQDICLESIMVRGQRKKIKELARELSQNRGIKSVKVHFMSLV